MQNSTFCHEYVDRLGHDGYACFDRSRMFLAHLAVFFDERNLLFLFMFEC